MHGFCFVVCLKSCGLKWDANCDRYGGQLLADHEYTPFNYRKSNFGLEFETASDR